MGCAPMTSIVAKIVAAPCVPILRKSTWKRSIPVINKQVLMQIQWNAKWVTRRFFNFQARNITPALD